MTKKLPPDDRLIRDIELLHNVKARLPELRELLADVSAKWNYEDRMYRFYYQSFKVYFLQDETNRIVALLRAVAPADTTTSSFFEEIIRAGTGIEFQAGHNKNWTKHTRPIVEAFLHAKYFLEMAVKYGKRLKTAPRVLPSGWAAPHRSHASSSALAAMR